MSLLNILLKKSWRHFILYIVISQLVILLSNHQLIQEIAATPSGKVNLLVHRDWPHDYFSYLAYMTQGESGFWLRYHPYTTEKSKPGLFHIYFIAIGKISKITGLQSVPLYHLTRIAAIEVFILSLWGVSRMLMSPPYVLWGALFGLLATFAPQNILPQKIQVTWYPYGYPWYENLDSLERLYMPAHHLAGQGIFLFSLYLLLSWIQKQTFWKLGLSGLAVFCAGVIFPPILLPVTLAIPIAFALFIVREIVKNKKIIIPHIPFLGLIIYGAFAFASYMVVSLQEQQGYPWNLTKLWEMDRWNNEPSFILALPYVFSFLPLFILPASIRAVWKGNWTEIFLILWATIPYWLYPFTDALQIPKIRLLHTVPYVPFGILTAKSISILVTRFRSNKLYMILIILFFVTTIPVTLYHLYFRILSVDYFLKRGDTREFYLSQNTIDSYLFIKQTLPSKSIVLSDLPTGSMLPGFAPVISFIGSQIDTIDFDSKRFFSVRFYKQEFGNDYAKDFLKSNSIEYVYLGPYEKAYGSQQLTYPFLTEIYNENDIMIYKVK